MLLPLAFIDLTRNGWKVPLSRWSRRYDWVL